MDLLGSRATAKQSFASNNDHLVYTWWWPSFGDAEVEWAKCQLRAFNQFGDIVYASIATGADQRNMEIGNEGFVPDPIYYDETVFSW